MNGFGRLLRFSGSFCQGVDILETSLEVFGVVLEGD